MTSLKNRKYLIFILIAAFALYFAISQSSPEKYYHEQDYYSLSAENERLEKIIEDGDFYIYLPLTISHGHAVSGNRIDEETALEAMDIYTIILNSATQNEPISDEKLAKYQKNVSLILWFAGKNSDAIEIIESINLANLTEEIQDEISIIKSGFYLSMAEFDKVDQALESIKTDEYDELKKLIETSSNNFSNPFISYTLEDYEISDKTPLDGYFSALPQYSQSKKYEKKESGNKISGYIRENGKAMAGIVIYIDTVPGISSSGDFNKYTVSDENGYYEISDPGFEKYHLSLQIPWNRIHDKQISLNYYSDNENFEFYDAAKLEYLNVEGDNLTYKINDPLNDGERVYHLTAKSAGYENANSLYSDIEISGESLQGSIPLDKLRSSFDISYSSYGYEEDLLLENFLEPLYLEDDYIFGVSVSTMDESSSYISNGFFPNSLSKKIHIESPYELSEGDKLLENKKFEEAIKWFENNESEHGFKVLAALYSRGYIINPEDKFAFEREGKNLEKALFYNKKLYELAPENEERLLKLLWAYGDLKMYDNEYSLIRKYREITNSKYGNFLLAKNEINRGNLLAGIKIYLECADPAEDYDRYFGYLFLANKKDDLPEEYRNHFYSFNLESFDPFFLLMKSGEYEKAYKWLESAHSDDKETDNLIAFYMLLYLDEFKQNSFDDFIEYYVEKTNEIENENLKWILKELKYNSNWF